jgi:hypothetical protein
MIGKLKVLLLFFMKKKVATLLIKTSIKALENKSTSNGVQVMKGVKVTGLKEVVTVRQLQELRLTKVQ